MGYDIEYIHGCIVLNESPENYYYQYTVTLSYTPLNETENDSLQFVITGQDGSLTGQLNQYITSEYGYTYSNYICDIPVLQNDNFIIFNCSFYDLPSNISGRYVTVNSAWSTDPWWFPNIADENPTHIQVGMTGAISGTVDFPGYLGGPIFVQAVSDLDDPDESIVAYTVLDGPGEYTLENIGLGFEGYVRAFLAAVW